MEERLDQMGFTKIQYIGENYGARSYKVWDHYNDSWAVVKFKGDGDMSIQYDI